MSQEEICASIAIFRLPAQFTSKSSGGTVAPLALVELEGESGGEQQGDLEREKMIHGKTEGRGRQKIKGQLIKGERRGEN